MATQNEKKALDSPAPAEENIYSFWTHEDRSDKRGIRVSIAVAALLHAFLLTVTFPQLYSEELADEMKEKKLFVVEVPRFKPKPPPPVDKIPDKLVKKIPIPDPEPDKPEPFVADVVSTPDMDFDVDTALVFNVPDPPPVPETKNVYVVGEIAAPERVHYVKPLYNEIARRARIEGLVIIKAVIDESGGVIDLDVLKSLPMGLAEEAVKAVEQWRYRPSTVDGRPVKVVLTVSVNFQLQ